MKRIIAFPAIVMVVILLSGCSPPGVEEAQVDFCQALDDYRDATAAVKEINEQTTLNELTRIRDNVSKKRQELLAAAGTLREARLRYAEDAWKQLEMEMDEIPGDAALGAAAPFVRGRAEELLTEIDRANNVSCERR